MKIGYARVSTQDQNLHSQLDALNKAGCEMIYQEKMSGKNTKDRPEFSEMIKSLRKGDTLIVWDITRLGRSILDLIKIVTSLKEGGIEFIAIKNNVDTSTPSGLLQYHILAALAEYERSMIKERTMAGLAAARSRGKIGGRPTGLTAANRKKADALKTLIKSGTSPTEAAKIVGIGRASAYRYLKEIEK